MTVDRRLHERLGYPPDARLLIVTSDDLGFTHSVNAAFIDAIDLGLLSSGSVMVPCPWFSEIAAFGRLRPDVDLGIHLTVTCECTTYRWGPVLGASAVPSLVVSDGGFPVTEDELLAQADLAELGAELRAQVALARSAGLQPTHLDSHMGVLYQRRDVYELLLQIGGEERLPVRHPRTWARDADVLASTQVAPSIAQNEHLRSAGEDLAPTGWHSFYDRTLRGLDSGVTELVLHVGYDTTELRAAYGGVEDWGAAWRKRDFDIATDDGIRSLVHELGITRIGWRDLAQLATGLGQ